MTLSGLHQRFLQHCEVEKRLAQQTIVAYRSDFDRFLEFPRERGRWGLASQDNLHAFTTGNVREYQYHMAAPRWHTNTIRRRLTELNSFGGWLVERSYLKAPPMAGVAIPRKERHLPRVLAWSMVERAVTGERDPRARAILALLGYGGLRRGEVAAANVGDYAPARQGQPGPRHRPARGCRRGARCVSGDSTGRDTGGAALHQQEPPRQHEGDRHQKLLGHESLATTQIYLDVSPVRQRAAMARLAG